MCTGAVKSCNLVGGRTVIGLYVILFKNTRNYHKSARNSESVSIGMHRDNQSRLPVRVGILKKAYIVGLVREQGNVNDSQSEFCIIIFEIDPFVLRISQMNLHLGLLCCKTFSEINHKL